MACMVTFNVEGNGTREGVMRLAKTIGAFIADGILPVPVLALATRSALDAQLRYRLHYYEQSISAPRRRRSTQCPSSSATTAMSISPTTV
jgi:hypothetical protein